MRSVREIQVVGAFVAAMAFCLTGIATAANYGGGSGTAEDPYQIWTPEQMNAIGAEPNDWDRHFKLMADIDLSAYDGKEGRPAFNAISPDIDKTVYAYQGTPFTGIFDGNHHTIAGLTLRGKSYVAMFGQIAPGARVEDLALVDIDVAAEEYSAGLAMCNGGVVTGCSSTGSVCTRGSAAGLVGGNGGLISDCWSTARVEGAPGGVGGLVTGNGGTMIHCSYTGMVRGNGLFAGGLVGSNGGYVRYCFAGGEVSGNAWSCGGLAGENSGTIMGSYSTTAVSSRIRAGGLVGLNEGNVCHCYCSGSVVGREPGAYVGGLIGVHYATVTCCYSTGEVRGGESEAGGLIGRWNSGAVVGCFWDEQASGRTWSDGGWPLTTAQMWDVATYTNAGWDWVGRVEDGTSEVWQMPAEGGYPVLAAFQGYVPPKLQGQGTREAPYLISDSRELGAMIYHDPYAHYRLTASIDLSGICWMGPVIPWFSGVFEGNDKTISHLMIRGGGWLGVFGELVGEANVNRLSIADANIVGSGSYVGALAGWNGGEVTASSSSGSVTATEYVGGLIGMNRGHVAWSHNVVCVSGRNFLGGLIGENADTLTHSRNTGTVVSTGGENIGGLVGFSHGLVAQCCNVGQVGDSGAHAPGIYAAGLVGWNAGKIINCYNTGFVRGSMRIGGLVADNRAYICHCYNAGKVERDGGGLVCEDDSRQVVSCFWDVEATGATRSDAGTGRTTVEMKTASTYLDAGWDFAGETANGTEDIWWIDEGRDYPRLWWEVDEKEDGTTASDD